MSTCGAQNPMYPGTTCTLRAGHDPFAQEVGGKMFSHGDFSLPLHPVLWDALPTDTVYEPILKQSNHPQWPHRVDVIKQDDIAAPGQFRMVRKMIAEEALSWGGFTVMVEVYRNPVREYPPLHVGSSGAGIVLNVEEATALRDALSAWLAEQTEKEN